jgi:hypothetical protein
MTMVSLLDISFRLVAYSIIAAPFAILIIGAILYYYKPIHRFTLGIILVTLGSIGLAIYSFVLLLTLINGEGSFGVLLLTLATLCVEVFTLYFGIKSLMRRNVSLKL